MRFIRPFAALFHPFITCKSLEQITITGQEIIAQAVIAQRPSAHKVSHDLIGWQIRFDKGTTTTLTYVSYIQHQMLHSWQIVAIIFVRCSPTPPVHREGVQEQVVSFRQCTVSYLNIIFQLRFKQGSDLLNAHIDAPPGADLAKKVFDTLSPEIEQKAHNTSLAIFKTLLPAQNKLYLAFFTCLRHIAFP